MDSHIVRYPQLRRLILAFLMCVSGFAIEAQDSIPARELRPVRLSAAPANFNPKNPDPYFVVPGYGLFYARKPGVYVGLDAERSAEIPEFIMPMREARFTQIVAGTDRFSAKSGRLVYDISSGSPHKLAELSSPAFRILPGSDEGIIALQYHPKGSQGWYIPFDSDKAITMVAQSESFIPKIEAVSDSTFIVADRNALWAVKGDKSEAVFSFDSPVTDFTITEKGLIVVLGKKVLQLTDTEDKLLFEGQIRRVYNDGGRLYFVAPEGSVFYIDI